MPTIANKSFLSKRVKKLLLSSIQKTKTTETSGSVFADGNEQVKKTKFNLEMTKM